jgi:hypothetical protein
MAVAAALLVGAGIPTGAPTHSGGDEASLSQAAPWPGALHAMLRPTVDGVENAIQGQKASGGRLLLLLAWPLYGLGLFQLLRTSRPPVGSGVRPSVARIRRWLSLRAPPSSRLA